jgi:hypothetical protein
MVTGTGWSGQVIPRRISDMSFDPKARANAGPGGTQIFRGVLNPPEQAGCP